MNEKSDFADLRIVTNGADAKKAKIIAVVICLL
jgi:hypothetical protein